MAAKTEEIPRSEWVRYLDRFTREHQGWQVNVEVLDREAGAQTEVHDLPLRGISADEKGSERDVSIIMGDEQNPELTHFIPGAQRLWLRSGERPSDVVLEIESSDGTKTLVRCRVRTGGAGSSPAD